MENNMSFELLARQKELKEQIEARVDRNLSPLLQKYGLKLAELDSTLKWKPIIVLIGNYSSGKSTLVNELLNQEIQRTGQAPTDDAFTVITSPESGAEAGEVPGSTLVNDDRMPFTTLKNYGEQFISHFRMKKVDNPILQNMAIVDTPGMLDSVTEKDRGYDYMTVLGEFAKLADLIVLMFDPHKAGTIKETYTTIRSTLPETSGEDRIVFVMSRIDECDNTGDLVRAYGTLCWNLSQMTGRKDIPRIFLTFSPSAAKIAEGMETWAEERGQLIKKILTAPAFRLSHMLQSVDKHAHQLRMTVEAVANFNKEARSMFSKTLKIYLALSVFLFLFSDVIIREVAGVPQQTFLSSLYSRSLQSSNFAIPVAGAAGCLFIMWAWFTKWRWPRFVKAAKADVSRFVDLQTAHQQHVWEKAGPHAQRLLARPRIWDMWSPHRRNIAKIDKFVKEDLRELYEKSH